MTVRKYVGISVLASVLSACGGGSSSPTPTPTPTPTPSTVTVSGVVSYDFVPHNSSVGLNYNAIESRTSKGVTVQLLDANQAVLATSETNAQGQYSFDVSANTNVRVRIVAELAGFGEGWQARIIDNTSSDAVYVIDGGLVSSGTSNSQRNIHAPSGWGGSSYTSARVAAPLAMLDTVYSAMQLVRSVDASASFAELNINWSVNNRPAAGSDLSTGNIGTSFFRRSNNRNDLFILGAEGTDTDEYDRHVIAHEWGHYFEANFSRSDSTGGPHSIGDVLDMRLAFGEGWGNGLAGIIHQDPVYHDSLGARQASGFNFDVDRNNNPADNPGWYSEGSVQAIVYDLFDTEEEAGIDTVALGFGPIYQVMTNEQKDTELVTSIFSFVSALKANNPQSADAIDTLVSGQNIVSNTIDARGSTETNNAGNANLLPIYTQVSANGNPVNVCLTDALGTRNRSGNRRFLTLNISSAGNYQFSAVRSPSGSNNSDPDISILQQGNTIRNFEGTAANTEVGSVNLSAGNYVIVLSDFNFVGNRSPRDSVSCFNVTVQ